MQKEFDRWNELKKKLERRFDKVNPPFFNEKEVWFTYIGINLGHETDGKSELFLRPVLVVRKYNKNLFLAAPLSTKGKDNDYYLNIGKVDSKQAFLLISQIRVMSSKRLAYKIHKLSDKMFARITEKLADVNFKIITPRQGGGGRP